MNLSSIPSIPPTVILREVDGVTTLVNLVDGACFTLDEIGGRVWQLLEDGHAIEATCRQLATEYAAPIDEIQADVVAFIGDLQDKGFVSAA